MDGGGAADFDLSGKDGNYAKKNLYSCLQCFWNEISVQNTENRLLLLESWNE